MKDWLANEHKNAWRIYEGAKHTKMFCKSPCTKVSQSLLSLKRPDLKRVVEAVTDHCDLNKHLFDINRAEDPKCACNMDKETCLHDWILPHIQSYKKYFPRQTIPKKRGPGSEQVKRKSSGRLS